MTETAPNPPSDEHQKCSILMHRSVLSLKLYSWKRPQSRMVWMCVRLRQKKMPWGYRAEMSKVLAIVMFVSSSSCCGYDHHSVCRSHAP